MECYAAIKRNEIMSFAGAWMELEAVILRKLTQERKTKYCMFSFTGGSLTMRTYGHWRWGEIGGCWTGEMEEEHQKE